MQLLNGKLISENILGEIAKEVKELRRKKVVPLLAVVLVGRDPASVQYVKVKKITAEEIGIDVVVHRLPSAAPERKLIELIRKFNKDPKVTGILVQFPLPPHISREKVAWAIDPKKDVDGFQMRLFEPPAPRAILEILRWYRIPIVRKRMLIVGEGFLVGRPLSVLAQRHGASVTTASSKTPRLELLIRNAEIIVSATGVPKLIKSRMVSQNQVVVDAGGGNVGAEVVGDVDFNPVARKVKAITPVPGGVGPVTVAILLQNVVKAAHKKSEARNPKSETNPNVQNPKS